MDRNGKKKKAVSDDTHAERSDTKSQSRDVLGRSGDEARAQAQRAAASADSPSPGKKGRKAPLN